MIPRDESLLLSPADGVVRDIVILESVPGFEGKTLRIGIFLSIFNVHINRVPCAVRIESITYKPGEFRDSRDPQATTLNESNDVVMTRLAEPKDRLMVRQISGAIARRIVVRGQRRPGVSGGGTIRDDQVRVPNGVVCAGAGFDAGGRDGGTNRTGRRNDACEVFEMSAIQNRET